MGSIPINISSRHLRVDRDPIGKTSGAKATMPRSRKPILRGTRVRMLFTVGKRRMYFAGTVRKVNGRCIYIRYDDGDRESVDIQSPRLKLLSTPATPSTPASTTTKRRKRSEETGETRNKSKRKAGQPPKRSAHYVSEGAKDNPIVVD